MKKTNYFIFIILTFLIISLSLSVNATNEMPEKFNEPPELKERVEEGELPPIEERLPDEPFVVGPGTMIPEENLDWEVGTYGGKLVGSTHSPEVDDDIRDASMEHILHSPKMERKPVEGNIVSEFEVNDDNTEFTFHIREGLRWSDGEPVTTDDVHFGYEKVTSDEKVTPDFPQYLRSGGKAGAEPLELEIIDDYRFKIISEEPYGGFLNWLGVGGQWMTALRDLFKPKHYLEQFHIDYTSLEEMQPDLEEEELDEDEWWTLLDTKDVPWYENTSREAANYPTLGPWKRVESGSDEIVMERNPYYFKVDIEGNQLPYIDTYESIIVSEAEMIPTLVIGGDVNMLRIRAMPADLPLFKEEEENADYKVLTDLEMHNSPYALFLNYTNEDETWRSVVNDVRFRRAIDKAIPRQKIIDDFYFGYGEPSPWTSGEYDPQKAETLLDEMGMDELDNEDYRLAPNGERFEILLELYDFTDDLVDITELIKAELEEIGIRTEMKMISGELRETRIEANELYASMDWLDTPNWRNLLLDDYLPYHRAQYGPAWDEWMNTNGDSGEEPPDWVKEGYELHRRQNEIRPDSQEAEEWAKDLEDWMHTNIPMFPLTEKVINPLIVPENLGNIAHSGMGSATHFAAEQFFFKE